MYVYIYIYIYIYIYLCVCVCVFVHKTVNISNYISEDKNTEHIAVWDTFACHPENVLYVNYCCYL